MTVAALLLSLSNDGGSDGASWIAILGAITGVLGLGLASLLAFRERARLHVGINVYERDFPDFTGPAVNVEIVNAGRLPTYITAIETTDHLPWQIGWPIFRSLSFRARTRWWYRPIRWIAGEVRYETTTAYLDADLRGRIDPGDQRSADLVVRLVNAPNRLLDTNAVGDLVAARTMLVVQTGTRRYIARLTDSRRAP